MMFLFLLLQVASAGNLALPDVQAMHWADFDGDGFDDLVSATDTGVQLVPFYDGEFQLTTWGASMCASALTSADIDDDGNRDLVFACESTGRTDVLWGDGNGSFDASIVVQVEEGCGLSIATGDATGTPAPDLVIGCSDRLEIWTFDGRQPELAHTQVSGGDAIGTHVHVAQTRPGRGAVAGLAPGQRLSITHIGND